MSEHQYDDSWASRANGILDRVFGSCADDPKGSVHRAWGISLIFVLLYFILSIVESELLRPSRREEKRGTTCLNGEFFGVEIL